jgi:tetratricopeptide (TPR) repeat protein
VSTIRGYDPETLREIVDQRECRERLEALGEQRSLPALLERVWLLKVLGDLDASLSYAELAVRHSRMAGTRKDLLRSRVLHATVLQARGSYAAAIAELDTCADEAEGQAWPNVAAFALQHRGKVHFDLEQFDEARADFKRALFLRQQAGAPEEALQTTLQAVDVAERRRAAVAVSA